MNNKEYSVDGLLVKDLPGRPHGRGRLGMGFRGRHRGTFGLGCHGPAVRVFGYLAAYYQYRDDYSNLYNGVHNPEHAEQGLVRAPAKDGRDNTFGEGGEEQLR
jgi:hypothetical protein